MKASIKFHESDNHQVPRNQLSSLRMSDQIPTQSPSDQPRSILSKRDLELLVRDVTVYIEGTVNSNGMSRSGTGFVISTSEHRSWILTNRHVVEGIAAERSHIYHANTRTTASFRIMYVLPTGADLALVETDIKFPRIPHISPRKRLDQGEALHTLGYPYRFPIFSTGTSTKRQRNDDTRRESKFTEVCNIFIDHGSSGSAVFDHFGDVVGVVWGERGTPSKPECLVVPVQYVRELLWDQSLAFLGAGDSDTETVVGIDSDVPDTDNEPGDTSESPSQIQAHAAF